MIASVKLETALRPLVNDRIYPDVAGTDEPLPYIVYHDISNQPEVTLDGPTGDEWVHVQLDVYDQSKLGCIKLANLVIRTINEQIPHSIYGGKITVKDAGLNRTTIDYEFWQTAPTE